jgi:hypothetical protein
MAASAAVRPPRVLALASRAQIGSASTPPKSPPRRSMPFPQPRGGYPRIMSSPYDNLRAALREWVHIADLLQARGATVRLNGRGGGSALCPFHDDHRPSLSIYRSQRDDTEPFRCWSCGSRGPHGVVGLARVSMNRRVTAAAGTTNDL